MMMSGQMPVSQNGMSSCGTMRPQTPKTHKYTHTHTDRLRGHIKIRAFGQKLENAVHKVLDREVNVRSSHKQVQNEITRTFLTNVEVSRHQTFGYMVLGGLGAGLAPAVDVSTPQWTGGLVFLLHIGCG